LKSVHQVKYLVFVFLVFTCLGSVYAQSKSVSTLRENHDTELALFFYPSTLRMINLQRNPEFNGMIKDIRKARVFKFNKENLDAAAVHAWIRDLKSESFEDYMMMKSRDMNVSVFGPEKNSKKAEIVALVDEPESYMVIDIEGMINVAKLPKLVQTFNSEEFIDIFNLNPKKNNKESK